MRRRLTPIAAAALIWAVNPTLGGCGGPDYTFGEAELLALLDSVNDQTWAADNYLVDFELDQSATALAMLRAPWSPLRAALACGDRSFVAEASACLDTTSLPLEGTVTVTDADSGEPVASALAVSGQLLVIGTNLSNAEVSLRHDGGAFFLHSDDGAAFELQDYSW